MRICVIIPCYNVESTVLRAYNSVKSQSRPVDLIIFVNDGSTDSTAKILYDIGERDKSVLVLTQTNKGLASARNVGLMESTEFDYIAFLDADDVWLKCKIQLQLEMLETNHLYVANCTDYISFDSTTGNEIYREDKLIDFSSSSLLLQNSSIWGSASSVVFKRKAVPLAVTFNESLEFAEDLDFWIKLSSFGFWSYTPSVLVRLQLDRNSMQGRLSTDPFPYINSSLKVLNHHKDYLSRSKYFFKQYRILLHSLRMSGISRTKTSLIKFDAEAWLLPKPLIFHVNRKLSYLWIIFFGSLSLFVIRPNLYLKINGKSPRNLFHKFRSK